MEIYKSYTNFSNADFKFVKDIYEFKISFYVRKKV